MRGDGHPPPPIIISDGAAVKRRTSAARATSKLPLNALTPLPLSRCAGEGQGARCQGLCSSHASASGQAARAAQNRPRREQLPHYPSAAMARSTLSAGLTFTSAWAIVPASSITKCERSTPMYFFPYMLFSTQTP